MPANLSCCHGSGFPILNYHLQAFILAQAVPEFRDRIRAIFFLATPHRGSDYASMLNNVLSVSGVMSSRHYISDLRTGSVSIQAINDQFGEHAHDLPIFSFYETLKTNLGISIVVVNKESAVLGMFTQKPHPGPNLSRSIHLSNVQLLGPDYKNERVRYINANHRNVCKFCSPEDPNYVAVKNALAGSIADILKDSMHPDRL